MLCSFFELRNKMVVNLRNGAHLGTVHDLELDTSRAAVTGIYIKGKLRWFGLLGREDNVQVAWKDIEVVGEDTILVNYTEEQPSEHTVKKRGKLLEILLEDG